MSNDKGTKVPNYNLVIDFESDHTSKYVDEWSEQRTRGMLDDVSLHESTGAAVRWLLRVVKPARGRDSTELRTVDEPIEDVGQNVETLNLYNSAYKKYWDFKIVFLVKFSSRKTPQNLKCDEFNIKICSLCLKFHVRPL